MASSDPKRPPWETSPWRSFQEEPAAPDPPSIGNMFSAIAIALGVGVLGYYMLDGHSHSCEACGHRWRHLGVFNVGDPAAHACHQCGTVQWWKDGVPHVFRDVLRQPPPVDSHVLRLQKIREAPRQALASASAPATAVTWVREVFG